MPVVVAPLVVVPLVVVPPLPLPVADELLLVEAPVVELVLLALEPAPPSFRPGEESSRPPHAAKSARPMVPTITPERIRTIVSILTSDTAARFLRRIPAENPSFSLARRLPHRHSRTVSLSPLAPIHLHSCVRGDFDAVHPVIDGLHS
jgi:hypothetical protein